ncbi:hypothetical protein NLI96_g645 [Meripilus lineatus]|uniref:Uncharacterized protein n=1 Tax=Meripilus lineatus TaxID=2056292 RepID=A0AAD5YNR4_9APHY|nr:hypothetical protein NLI96_g645 [Physisporinus lineatus]
MMKERVVSFIRTATSRPQRRDSALSQAITHVGRLPPETFIDIIHYLVFPTLPQALLFLHSTPGIDAATDTWGLVEIQTALYRVTLVCRAWNIIGTELLYTYPTFVSPRQVRNFGRTLQQAPSLARFIKHIFVVEASNLPLRRDRKRTIVPNIVRDILQACKDTTLDTLTTDVVNYTGSDSIASYFLDFISVSSRLRRLVINGIPNQLSFSQLRLPNLEILCLRTTFISGNTVFPILPKLHTLQIAKGDIWVELGEVILDDRLPALRSLELYLCEYVTKTFHPLSLPHLETMNFVGKGELELYKHLLISGALDSIKNITIGFVESLLSPIDLSETQLPLKIESLSLIGFYAQNAGIVSIAHYLERNQAVLPAKHFRRLDFSCSKIDCESKHINQLQTLCSSLEIEFHLNKIEPNKWISQRLACW